MKDTSFAVSIRTTTVWQDSAGSATVCLDALGGTKNYLARFVGHFDAGDEDAVDAGRLLDGVACYLGKRKVCGLVWDCTALKSMDAEVRGQLTRLERRVRASGARTVIVLNSALASSTRSDLGRICKKARNLNDVVRVLISRQRPSEDPVLDKPQTADLAKGIEVDAKPLLALIRKLILRPSVDGAVIALMGLLTRVRWSSTNAISFLAGGVCYALLQFALGLMR